MFATLLRFPGGSDSKKSACNVGDLHSIPGSGTSLGEGNGNPLQCSCLENSTNRGYSRWGRKESDTTEQLIQSLSTSFYTPPTQCVKKKKAFFLLETPNAVTPNVLPIPASFQSTYRNTWTQSKSPRLSRTRLIQLKLALVIVDFRALFETKSKNNNNKSRMMERFPL